MAAVISNLIMLISIGLLRTSSPSDIVISQLKTELKNLSPSNTTRPIHIHPFTESNSRISIPFLSYIPVFLSLLILCLEISVMLVSTTLISALITSIGMVSP